MHMGNWNVNVFVGTSRLDIARLTPHLLRDVPTLQETETEASVCKIVGLQSCSCSDTPPPSAAC